MTTGMNRKSPRVTIMGAVKSHPATVSRRLAGERLATGH
jgi:hypothetical protein